MNLHTYQAAASTALLLFGLSTRSVAQTFSQDVRPRASDRTTSVEVKPLPLALSVLPGLGAAGIGVEQSAAPNVAVFGEGYLSTVDMTKRMLRDNDKSTTALPDRVNVYAVDVGARIYTVPQAHAWYAGGKVGYARNDGDWVYRDQTVSKRVDSVTPGVEGGYRWLFENGFLVRLGAGAGGNVIVAEKTDSSKATSEAVDKVDAITKPTFSGKLDLGLGYAF